MPSPPRTPGTTKSGAVTLADARRAAAAKLAQAGYTSAPLEADLVVGAVTGLDRARLIAWSEQPLSSAQQVQFEQLVSRRLQGEPIAHLLGLREFWSLELRVGPATLIPRPETETLVEHALAALPERSPLWIADLGTGSGAIAAALAHERRHWMLLGVELSDAALAIAADNKTYLGLSNLALIRGDWSAAFAPSGLDAILANPPYVPQHDPHLSQGDLRFEPRSALAAGTDGLAAIRAILADAPRCLRPGGLLALEHGWDQANAVRALLSDHKLTEITTVRDLAGHERVTSGRAPGR
ncbi:MAG: peptide chain release factor N(5)-glutamine methyltransferase [Gammaproteobacteria bacterium]|nr:peptide chain release factor N(5)-glutamine methyltransferase [Gammaproteobacteria bacterium]